MKQYKLKSFFKFLIPSLLGVFLFITPIKFNGQITVPVAAISSAMLSAIESYSQKIITVLIATSGFLSFICIFFKPKFIMKNTILKNLFEITPFWGFVRICGGVFALMIYFNSGVEIVISPITGTLVATTLLPILLCVFFLAGLLLPLILNYGLLDFFGYILTKVMRPVFSLPGRSAIDCIASWIGDGTIGVLMTSKQYEQGYYSQKEATVIATCFSAVSITFSLVIINQVGLFDMFIPFYLTVSIAGIIAAIVLPKLPPIKNIPNSYHKNIDFDEKIPKGMSSFKYGLKSAIQKAEKAPSFKNFLKEGTVNVLDMWVGVLPTILVFGTLSLILAEYTPIFKILGAPFIPIYAIFNVPEAADASTTVIVGFADMFLPSVIASSKISSKLTRFIVAATSVCQLIYMSEIGSVILSSKIPISLSKLFIIFIQRTLITLPIIIVLSKFIF